MTQIRSHSTFSHQILSANIERKWDAFRKAVIKYRLDRTVLSFSNFLDCSRKLIIVLSLAREAHPTAVTEKQISVLDEMHKECEPLLNVQLTHRKLAELSMSVACLNRVTTKLLPIEQKYTRKVKRLLDTLSLKSIRFELETSLKRINSISETPNMQEQHYLKIKQAIDNTVKDLFESATRFETEQPSTHRMLSKALENCASHADSYRVIFPKATPGMIKKIRLVRLRLAELRCYNLAENMISKWNFPLTQESAGMPLCDNRKLSEMRNETLSDIKVSIRYIGKFGNFTKIELEETSRNQDTNRQFLLSLLLLFYIVFQPFLSDAMVLTLPAS